MNHEHNADASAKAEDFIRSTLRRRRDECANGLPSNDPMELGALIHAFWQVLSQARAQLLRAVGHRAAAAYRGFDYHGSEDVLHDSLVKACEFLVAQYNGEDSSFVFDVDGDRTIVAWITSVIGDGFGAKAGVLGTHLQRERRNAVRFIEATSKDEQTTTGIHDDALLVTDGIDAARHLEARETLQILAKRAEELDSERRFAVETLLLFRGLCGDEDESEFWDQLEKLHAEIWGLDQHHSQSSAVIQAFRKRAPARLTATYILEMIKTIVARGHRQITRWFDAFIKDMMPPSACVVGI